MALYTVPYVLAIIPVVPQPENPLTAYMVDVIVDAPSVEQARLIGQQHGKQAGQEMWDGDTTYNEQPAVVRFIGVRTVQEVSDDLSCLSAGVEVNYNRFLFEYWTKPIAGQNNASPPRLIKDHVVVIWDPGRSAPNKPREFIILDPSYGISSVSPAAEVNPANALKNWEGQVIASHVFFYRPVGQNVEAIEKDRKDDDPNVLESWFI